MNSYLNLVSEYEKVHKKKNRLTVICIVISVMLVTAIFSMADMSIQAQIDDFIRQSGNFHMIIHGIGDEKAIPIGGRKDVAASSFVGMAEDTVYERKELVVQSSSQEFAREMNLEVTEGSWPATAGEGLLDRLGMEQFGLSIGDSIEIAFHDGIPRTYRITGTYGDFSGLRGTDAHGLFLSPEGMRALPEELYQEYYYIQFRKGTNIRQAVAEMKKEYGLTDNQVSVNFRLLGLMGQSDDDGIVMLYVTAFILFILVTMAGTCMIASSFNMSIMERTRFFGLLRCLGATKKQVKRYIRLEGLRYCQKGIPLGLLAGCGISWISIFFLNSLRIDELPPMPLFQISVPGVGAGIAIGFLVVMIASGSPAKKAAKVSPQAAITGNISQAVPGQAHKAARADKFRVETAMGISHAYSNKKSMCLIAGSFGISIVLFLCFSVLVTFMNYALNPLKPYAPDISLLGASEREVLEPELLEKLKELPYIKHIYARMFLSDIPAADDGGKGTAMLISYDEPQFAWAGDMLVSGNMDDVIHGNGVLVDYETARERGWKTGDRIVLSISGQERELYIGAMTEDVPFMAQDGGWSIVCSEATFTALTGITDYTIIDMQVKQDISSQVRSMISPEIQLLDKQQGNSEVRSGYYAMAVFVYGFLLVIALVALINIINTVNASVSSRMGNYGVMRAVGMSVKQLRRMVLAEAAVYGLTGSVAGGVLGLLLHRYFFRLLITHNWGAAWEPPITVLAVAVTASLLTTLAAVISPSGKIGKMSIVNVVNGD